MNSRKFGAIASITFLGILCTMPVPTAAAAVRTVHINITDKGFQPHHVVALVGQPVRLDIVNKGHKPHQFSISKYRIFTQNLKPGQTSNVQFSPWGVGNYQMMSDPSGQDKPEFTGRFIVTDQK